MTVKRTGPGVAKGLDALIGDAERLVQNAGLACEKVAKEKAPVDTGNLRNSIAYQQVSPRKAVVSTGVAYAIHVEYGTRYMPGRYYFRAGYEAGRYLIRKGL